MAAAVTITISDADLPRVTAALAAAGIAQPKQALISYIVGFVQAYEQQQDQQHFAATYAPIVPT